MHIKMNGNPTPVLWIHDGVIGAISATGLNKWLDAPELRYEVTSDEYFFRLEENIRLSQLYRAKKIPTNRGIICENCRFHSGTIVGFHKHLAQQKHCYAYYQSKPPHIVKGLDENNLWFRENQKVNGKPEL